MDSLTLTATVIGAVVGLTTLISLLGKVFFAVAKLEAQSTQIKAQIEYRYSELEHQIDKAVMLSNQVGERMEHIDERLKGHLKEMRSAVTDLENYLTKNTPYEKRRSD